MSESLAQADSDSYYGSDFDEDEDTQLQQLLNAIEVNNNVSPLIEDAKPTLAHAPESALVLHLPKSSVCKASSCICSSAAVQAEFGKPIPESDTVPHDESPGRIRWATQEPKADSEDDRTPLERFRTAPKKPLSVTDFVSPAWCELQYWYNLTKFGKVQQTPAMKRGSEVHRVLEDEVHETVSVETQTREDSFGLRIWNLIQGLRTLRATGKTRELEVWGIIEGQVVIGIIDELSLSCTDPGLEHSIGMIERTGSREVESSEQTKISKFFGSGHNKILEQSNRAVAGVAKPELKVYLTDVKTRGSQTIPNEIAMRPTELQLMLYRELLAKLASNNVDPKILFHRYDLNPSKRFSDSLIAQLSTLCFSFPTGMAGISHGPLGMDTVAELFTHNSLSELWRLMIEEFQKTMPKGAESVSKVLKAEFRNPNDGSVIGMKTFPFKEDKIRIHVAEEMRWWNGEREARGVDVEEAFKCRICLFADECTWRLGKVENALSASKQRLAAKKISTR